MIYEQLRDLKGIVEGFESALGDTLDSLLNELDERTSHGIDPEKQITVCDSCLSASCWHGEFMCENSTGAGILDLPVWALERLDIEHPDVWKNHDKVHGIKAVTS